MAWGFRVLGGGFVLAGSLGAGDGGIPPGTCAAGTYDAKDLDLMIAVLRD